MYAPTTARWTYADIDMDGREKVDTPFGPERGLTITPDTPQWNAVTIACMYGKKSMLLNPRRAVELALLSGTLRRMKSP